MFYKLGNVYKVKSKEELLEDPSIIYSERENWFINKNDDVKMTMAMLNFKTVRAYDHGRISESFIDDSYGFHWRKWMLKINPNKLDVE